MNETAENGNTSQYDAFLSYNRKDKDAVRGFASRLQDNENLHPFFDDWSLVPGLPLQEQLESALQTSASCVVFIGPSGPSPWQTEEARVVLEDAIENRQIRVIPVLLPGAEEETLKKLPLLRRYPWVDFRDDINSQDSLTRLAAGIRGKAPGRKSSETIAKTSLFVQKSTIELFQQFLSPLDISQLPFDSHITLDQIAKLLKLHYPEKFLAEIKAELSKARSLVYDEKYAGREVEEDERYINYPGWQNEVRELLSDCGYLNFDRLDVVNVGIGNGNENPSFYREFRKLIGVDTSQRSLDRAVKAMPFMQPIHGEAEDLKDIPSDSQDLYLSFRTYQSSYFNISEAAFEAARVLRHRGGAVISVPNVYVDKGKISKGLQKGAGNSLDPHLGWELADRVRRALYQAEFDAWITTGLFEIFVVGQK